MPKYSIVAPLHNEQENVTDLYDRLKAVMELNGESFEMVLVDDGSTDRSFHLLREIAAVTGGLRLSNWGRIFGQHSVLAPDSAQAGADTFMLMTAVCRPVLPNS